MSVSLQLSAVNANNELNQTSEKCLIRALAPSIWFHLSKNRLTAYPNFKIQILLDYSMINLIGKVCQLFLTVETAGRSNRGFRASGGCRRLKQNPEIFRSGICFKKDNEPPIGRWGNFPFVEPMALDQ
jgi:hypothetical protein